MNNKSIVAMIPARMGSTRLARKNLALLNGKPLIYYAIEAAKQAGVFSRIVVNSEDPVFGNIANNYGVDFYLRPAPLGGSDARSDEVIYDFMKHNSAEVTVWVNTTSPLQTGDEIKRAVGYFSDGRFDSLITVKEEQVHALYDGKPLNFKENELFAKTQDLSPVQRFVYSVMIWRNQTFLEIYKNQGYALLCGKTGYFPVSKETSLIVKTEDDLRLIEYILAGKNVRRDYQVRHETINVEARFE
ncbi:hypothetical protein HZC34_07825 [Candidatus Saganbacteria bacterium]|nr:hypothetical protein [Candidatus Saganbacteria bacterium]